MEGHCVAKGFVVLGSCNDNDLINMFYFDDKGKLKVLFTPLYPSLPLFSSFLIICRESFQT